MGSTFSCFCDDAEDAPPSSFSRRPLLPTSSSSSNRSQQGSNNLFSDNYVAPSVRNTPRPLVVPPSPPVFTKNASFSPASVEDERRFSRLSLSRGEDRALKECALCMEEFEGGAPHTSTTCGCARVSLKYHPRCLQAWKTPVCPLCGESIVQGTSNDENDDDESDDDENDDFFIRRIEELDDDDAPDV